MRSSIRVRDREASNRVGRDGSTSAMLSRGLTASIFAPEASGLSVVSITHSRVGSGMARLRRATTTLQAAGLDVCDGAGIPVVRLHAEALMARMQQAGAPVVVLKLVTTFAPPAAAAAAGGGGGGGGEPGVLDGQQRAGAGGGATDAVAAEGGVGTASSSGASGVIAEAVASAFGVQPPVASVALGPGANTGNGVSGMAAGAGAAPPAARSGASTGPSAHGPAPRHSRDLPQPRPSSQPQSHIQPQLHPPPAPGGFVRRSLTGRRASSSSMQLGPRQELVPVFLNHAARAYLGVHDAAEYKALLDAQARKDPVLATVMEDALRWGCGLVWARVWWLCSARHVAWGVE